MKGNILKKVTIILLVLLICLVSFVGIYGKELNKMVNIMPDYKVGMDFGEIRGIRLNVSDEVETKYYDAEGNETKPKEETQTEGEENKQEDITSKEVPVNPEEVLTRRKFCKD